MTQPDPWTVFATQAAAPAIPWTSPSLEDRLLVLEDERAIRELVIRWAYLHDADALEEKVALHHEDCVVHHRSGDIRGHDAIREFFALGPPNELIADMRHSITNSIVRHEDRDTALVTSLYQWTQTMRRSPGAEAKPAVGGGFYIDRVVRAGREWKFAERRIDRAYDFFLPEASFGALTIGSEALSEESLTMLRQSGLLTGESNAPPREELS
ncbi:MAG: hypothetical protein JWP85_2334 [Rhodoglobus sp.]|nr:hypothetical protein [Rhodoglobus sp.]